MSRKPLTTEELITAAFGYGIIARAFREQLRAIRGLPETSKRAA
jgi:hypothetical protein